MIKFLRTATEAEIEDRKRASLEILGELEAKVHPPGSPAPRLTPELISYLRLIADNPGIPATKRDKSAGISAKKGFTTRQQLKALGLIQEFGSVGEKGRKAVEVRLTDRGKTFLI